MLFGNLQSSPRLFGRPSFTLVVVVSRGTWNATQPTPIVDLPFFSNSISSTLSSSLIIQSQLENDLLQLKESCFLHCFSFHHYLHLRTMETYNLQDVVAVRVLKYANIVRRRVYILEDEKLNLFPFRILYRVIRLWYILRMDFICD